MKFKVVLFVALFSLLAFFVSANVNTPKSDFEIGSTIENFTMPDPNGKDHSYNDLKGTNGSLIVFLSAQCPVVKMYNDRINALADEYKAKGINFIGIYPNHTESDEWVKEHSSANYK
ncbi:MAG: redoxin domain-containing protein, partial [Pyrinomonadaceae bacterium]